MFIKYWIDTRMTFLRFDFVLSDYLAEDNFIVAKKCFWHEEFFTAEDAKEGRVRRQELFNPLQASDQTFNKKYSFLFSTQ